MYIYIYNVVPALHLWTLFLLRLLCGTWEKPRGRSSQSPISLPKPQSSFGSSEPYLPGFRKWNVFSLPKQITVGMSSNTFAVPQPMTCI